MTYLYVDADVPDRTTLLTAVNKPQVTLVNDITSLITGTGTNCTRLGLLWLHDGDKIPLLPAKNTKPSKKSTPTYTWYSDNLVAFLQKLGSLQPQVQVDLITCSLNDPTFIAETKTISELCNLKIEYSVNMTGNPDNGGDWILESNGEDLRSLYFNSNLSQWKYVLDTKYWTNISDINTSLSAMGLTPTAYITYDTTKQKYKLLQNLQLVGVNSYTRYHLILYNGQTFDGNGFTLSLVSGNATRGFFVIHGSDASLIKVNDVTINADHVYTGDGLAGVVVRNNCWGFTLDKCSAKTTLTNNISSGGGGVVGGGCVKFVVSGCKNYVPFSEYSVGGIVGNECWNFKVYDCTNYANIGLSDDYANQSGGIVGYRCSMFEVHNCTNNGTMYGSGCGGIVGGHAYIETGDALHQRLIVKGCTNNGMIYDDNLDYGGGGIVGYEFGFIYDDIYGSLDRSDYAVQIIDRENNAKFTDDVAGIIGTCGFCIELYGNLLFKPRDKNGAYIVGYNLNVLVKNCHTKSGPICGWNTMGVVVYSDPSPCTIKVDHRPKIVFENCTTSSHKCQLMESTYSGLCFDLYDAIYITKSGKKINLIEHPDYVLRH